MDRITFKAQIESIEWVLFGLLYIFRTVKH